MQILILVLTILNLIFVYKNKILLSKVIAVISMLSYAVYSLRNIVPLMLIMKSGVLEYQAFLWTIIMIVLYVILLLTIWKGTKKASLWLLWIMFAVLILSNWNTWLTYILMQ